MKKSKEDVSKRYNPFVLSAVLMLTVLMLFSGCQNKATTQPEETNPPPPQKITQHSETTQQHTIPETISDNKEGSVISGDMDRTSAEGKEGMFADIMFDYDKYDVKENFKSELKTVAVWMTNNSSAIVSVEGNCDERGTNEYNLALGDRRAKAVKDYLVSMGVPSSRIETISYGEEKPVCTEHSEGCWAKNRRAHLVVLTKAGK